MLDIQGRRSTVPPLACATLETAGLTVGLDLIVVVGGGLGSVSTKSGLSVGGGGSGHVKSSRGAGVDSGESSMTIPSMGCSGGTPLSIGILLSVARLATATAATSIATAATKATQECHL